MRIVIPTGENNGYLSKMGAHFGKAPFYTIITTDENGEIVDVEGIENPGHSGGACGNAVANILALNPEALIVVGIGQSPAEGFAKAGLSVYVDRESVRVEESIKKLYNNQLQKITTGTCSIK
jgi:predicted Fe-Mo cluster-binding NifX family protein